METDTCSRVLELEKGHRTQILGALAPPPSGSKAQLASLAFTPPRRPCFTTTRQLSCWSCWSCWTLHTCTCRQMMRWSWRSQKCPWSLRSFHLMPSLRGGRLRGEHLC